MLFFFHLAVLPMNINMKANSSREQITVLLFTKIEDQSLHLVSDLISTSHILEKQSLLLVSTDCFLFSLYGNFTCFSIKLENWISVPFTNSFQLMVK